MVANKQSIKIQVEDVDEAEVVAERPKKTTKKIVKKSKTSTKKTVKKSVRKATKKATVSKIELVKPKALDIKIQQEVEDMNVAIKNVIKETRDKKLESKKINVIDEDVEQEEIKEPELSVLKPVPEEPLPEKKKPSIDELLNDQNSVVKELVASEDKIEKEQEQAKVVENFSPKENKRSLKLYRRIAYFFVALTVVLVVVVSYFTFAKVSIVLIPNQERVSNNMIFDVFDKDNNLHSGTNSIKGIVKEIKIEKQKEYEAHGEEIIGKEAAGEVIITNTYVKNQPLVATTRFLTPDGKLFRLRNTVNVPAGGSVVAELYADAPSPDMAISPTKFTIPGLWAGLQDKIYAESSESIKYSKKVKKHITADDIENSIRDLKQQMLTEAKITVNEEYKEYGQILYKIDEDSISSEVLAETGEEKDVFSATMEAGVVVVAFNDDQATNLAKQKFVSSLAEGREMLSFDQSNIVYALNNYDSEKGSATINATFEGRVSLSDDFDVVKIDKILGLSEEQLNVYLESLQDIAGFEVNFKPSFIKKVPKLKDKIEVKVRK